MSKMIALSWSRYSDFAQCPRKFYLKYIEKSFPPFDDKSPHLVRGRNLHKQLEDYADYLKFPNDMADPDMAPETASLRPALEMMYKTSVSLQPESQIAINTQWKQVEWFARDAYWRLIVDLIAIRQNHVIIWDYKSGKFQPYAEQCGQLHLTAAVFLAGNPAFEFAQVDYVYLDSKRSDGVKITRDQVPEIIKIFDARSKAVNEEVDWTPTKNEFCNWCDAKQSQCKFSKKAG